MNEDPVSKRLGIDAELSRITQGKWVLISPDGRAWRADDPRALTSIAEAHRPTSLAQPFRMSDFF